MRLLAWDTSSKVGAIAAIEWNPALSAREGWNGVRLVSEWTVNVDATHSERLLWAVHQLLESCRWKLEDVDVFGVGVGPGSFTGLRIGMTTARTLAQVAAKPLVGVSSLAALARPVASWCSTLGGKGALGRTVVVATTDACKGELFALWGAARAIPDCVALADETTAGLWKRGVEERVSTPADLMTAINAKLKQGARDAQWAVVGEGRRRYSEAWAKLPKSRELKLPPMFSDQVQGRVVAQLAWEGWQAGLARDALAVRPRYLRAADAELKLRAGLLPPGPTRGHA